MEQKVNKIGEGILQNSPQSELMLSGSRNASEFFSNLPEKGFKFRVWTIRLPKNRVKGNPPTDFNTLFSLAHDVNGAISSSAEMTKETLLGFLDRSKSIWKGLLSSHYLAVEIAIFPEGMDFHAAVTAKAVRKITSGLIDSID
jgi:hypothetical protein